MSSLRVAMCQLAVTANKALNITRASAMIADAKSKGAELVILPECFNAPYDTKQFRAYAEDLSPSNTTYDAMSEAAKQHNVWLIAGSVPELDSEGKVYNTSMTFAPDGTLAGKHRKIHLFRLNSELVKFDEGETLTAGDTPTVVPCVVPETGTSLSIGIGICFDVRFPNLGLYYAAQGTSLMVYPSAFNLVTGPLHWELNARSRAVDNQQFVIFVSPARDTTAGYVAYGHSIAVNPKGEVIAMAGVEECLTMVDLDLGMVATTRATFPFLKGRREDLYSHGWKL